MKTIYYILSLCFVLGTWGCQDDTQEMFSTTESGLPKEDFDAYTGETIQVEFDASLPEAEVSATRALQEDEAGKLHMDYSNWVGDVNVHIALRKKNNADAPITYKTVPGRISKNGSTYTLNIAPTSLQLRDGFFDGASWEVCAMIDKRNSIVLDGQYQSREFNTMTYLDPESSFNLQKLEVPIYSSYRDVIVNGRNKTLQLRFKPLGSVITATFENSLYTTIYYTGVNIQQANVIAGDLVLDFGKEITDTRIPAVKRKNGNKTKRCMFDFKTKLTAPNTITKKIYLWCLPVTKEQIANPRFGMFFKVGDNDQEPDSIMYKSPKTLASGFETGMNYRMALRMPDSDLMITEFGHLNPGGNNYTWIELFNPTNHDINLKQYGLVRVHEWKRENGDGPYDAIWQSLLVSWHTKCNIENALVQNLYVKEPSDPIYSASGQTYTDPYIKNRFEPMFMNSSAIAKYKTDGYLLKPGKTIVLYAGGTRVSMRDKWGLHNEYWPHNNSGFGSYYLANAVAQGRCQYVIAVDNGGHENAYGGMGDWKSDLSGTLQHSSANSILLLKRSSLDSGPYNTVLDALAGTVNDRIYKSFRSRMPARMTSTKDWWWAGRSVNTMFPMGLRFPEDIEFGTPFSADSPWGSNDPFGFMDWKIFIADWTWFKHLLSPGTRSYDNTIYNSGQKMQGALNEWQ